MSPLGKIFERGSVLGLLVSIKDERREHRSVHIEGKDVPEDGSTLGDKGSRFGTPDGVEYRAVLFLCVGHPSPSAKKGKSECIGYLRGTTDGDVVIVRDVLTPQIGLDSVEGDVFVKGIGDEGGIEDIEIIPGEAEDTVPDDRVRNPKGAGDLTVASAGVEAVVKVLDIDGEVRPVMNREGLSRAGPSAVFTSEAPGSSAGE